MPLKRRFDLLIVFAFVNAVIICFLGLPYLKAILSYQSLLKNTLFDFSHFPWNVLIYVFALLNYVAHLFLLSALLLMPLALLFLFIANKRFIKVLMVVVFSVAVIGLLVDILIFSTFHFHLNGTIIGFILSPEFTNVFDLTSMEQGLIVLVAIGVFVLELYVFKICHKHSQNTIALVKRGWLYWAVILLMSYTALLVSMACNNNLLTQQVSNLPLYHQVFARLLPGEQGSRVLYNFSENYFSLPSWGAQRLIYPKKPLSCSGKPAAYNLVILTAEALRYDNLGRGVMPKLATLSKHEINFTQHYAASNATQGSLFSLFYGIPGTYWSKALSHQIKPILMQQLEKAAIERKIIWSSEMQQPAFDKTIYLGIRGLHKTHQPGATSSDWDRKTTHEVVDYISDKAKSAKPFFLHVFYNTTHAYCQHNSIAKIYQPELAQCQRIGWHSKAYQQHLYNRYKNAARFVDSEIATVIRALKKQKLYERTIVIVTGDHGEEFDDSGLGFYGHAGNFTRFQLHVPMVVHWPGITPKQISYPTSHYDVAPTLLQQYFYCQNPASDYSVGDNLFHVHPEKRLLNVSSYAYQGIVHDRGIVVLRRSGEVEYQDEMGRVNPHIRPKKAAFAQAMQALNRFNNER